ncbi:MAG: ImmA/IrrE family metallo-endopeptidase [Peptococcaceae bacterium]|nr:ImmA/IrrE family metallo-endopeptidase [Peptococcaceae bacterium]
MTKMTNLLKLAEIESINIVYARLRKRKDDGLWGLYVPGRLGKNPTIYLDVELLCPKLHRLARCILAEELGHHFTFIDSCVFKIRANYSLERKMNAEDEKALRWATNYLIPTAELITLLKEGYECNDLAEYFGVTVWFLYRKLEFLQYQTKAKKQEVSWKLASKAKISCI